MEIEKSKRGILLVPDWVEKLWGGPNCFPKASIFLFLRFDRRKMTKAAIITPAMATPTILPGPKPSDCLFSV